jgi:UDP-glucose 4-epimerase
MLLESGSSKMAPTSEPAGWTLVTGGAGGIGHRLVKSLRARGQKVRVLDNLSSGTRGNLRGFAGDPGIEVIEADVLDAGALGSAIRGVDFVWHLAANPDVRRGGRETDLDLTQGPVATQRLLEAMRREKVSRIAFSSSSVVYGLPRLFPTPEDYGPLLPESLYGAAKLACEGLVSAFAHSFGMTAWVFRFANVCGPGATHGVIYDFLKKLQADPRRLEVLGDGRQRKGYLHVDDCVASMLHLTERTHEPVNVFNLGPGDTFSVREIAERVVTLTGTNARIEYTGGERGWPGDVPQQDLAIGRLLSTGFKPRYGSAEVVDLTILSLMPELGFSPVAPHG